MLTVWYPTILSYIIFDMIWLSLMYCMDFLFSWSGSESSESDPQSPMLSLFRRGKEFQVVTKYTSLVAVCSESSDLDSWLSLQLLKYGWLMGVARSLEGQQFFATDYERCKPLSWDTIQHHTAKNMPESFQRIFKVAFFRRLRFTVFFALRICQPRQFQQTGGSFRRDPSAAVEVRVLGQSDFLMVIPSWTHKKLTMLSIRLT